MILIHGVQHAKARQETIRAQTGIRVVGDTVFSFAKIRAIMFSLVELRSLVSPYSVLEAT